MARGHLGGHLSISVGMSAAMLFCMLTGRGVAQEKEVVAAGRLEYQQYCVTCHGATGKGDGPMASILTVKPADLTQLRKHHGGQFPFWHVYRD